MTSEVNTRLQRTLMEFGFSDPTPKRQSRPRREVGGGLLTLPPPEVPLLKRKRSTKYLRLFPEGQQALVRYWNPRTGHQQGQLY
ncbi:MAG: hypothetical protein ACE5OZ_17135 [Candidatus Heimdallarchaeota archaeon]